MGTRARGGPRQPPNPHPIYRLTDGVRSTRPVQHSAKSVARCFTVAGRPHPTPTKRYETACFRTAPWSPARGTFREKSRTVFHRLRPPPRSEEHTSELRSIHRTPN